MYIYSPGQKSSATSRYLTSPSELVFSVIIDADVVAGKKEIEYVHKETEEKQVAAA